MATAKKIVMAAASTGIRPTLTQAFNSGVLAGGTSQSSYSQWSYTFTAPALPSIYGTGKRHFFVMTGTRDSGGAIDNNRNTNTLASMRIENSANSINTLTARTSMTVNVGKTLVNWNSTSNGVAVGLIFKSGTSAGSNTSITNCRIYDPSATTSNLISAGVANDDHINPFSSAIDLYGNTGGSVSSGTYTVPIRNADGMYLDSTDNELYVIVRYAGDPTPIDDITLTFS